MLFASFSYILVFFPIVIIACLAVRRLWGPKAAQLWILIASIVFYAKGQPFNLIYLAASVLANWGLALAISRTEDAAARKRVLIVAVTANVLYLCAFKYLRFFAGVFAFALPHGYTVPLLGFPLGISFFTITQVMYLIDCYEGMLEPNTLFDHATFVTFFPYVISGPLSHAAPIRQQFGYLGGKPETFARGLFHFSFGIFKKTVYADAFSRVATYGFDTARNPSAIETWIFTLAYALQVYFDFSGYSDMAIGSAMMLGIEVPRNFNSPFSAKSIIEFWQRWHMSLTSFITGYLYTPILRLFRKSTLLTSGIATFLAMGITGLWHGPAFTFLTFGLLHGAYLSINQVWRKKKMPRIPAFPSWLLTFACLLITFIYFGSATVEQATSRVITLFNPHHAFSIQNLGEMGVQGISLRIFGGPLIAGAFVAFFGKSSETRAREFRPTALNCAYAVGLLLVALLFLNSNIPSPFVYFRF